MRFVKLIVMTIVIASGLALLCAHAEEAQKTAAAATLDESRYNKDTLPVDDTYACQVGNRSACEVPVLLNKTDKREDIRTQRQLKRMQDEMNRHIRESMDEGQRDTPAHK